MRGEHNPLYFSDIRYGSEIKSLKAANDFLEDPGKDADELSKPWHPHSCRAYTLPGGDEMMVPKHIVRADAGWQVRLKGSGSRFFTDNIFGGVVEALTAATGDLKARWHPRARARTYRPIKHPIVSNRKPRLIEIDGKQLAVPPGIRFDTKSSRFLIHRRGVKKNAHFLSSRYGGAEEALAAAVEFVTEELATNKLHGNEERFLAPWHSYRSRHKVIEGEKRLVPQYIYYRSDQAMWTLRAPGHKAIYFKVRTYGTSLNALDEATRHLQELMPEYCVDTGRRIATPQPETGR
ncbi:MAG: hypothetical protein ACRER5_16255 [Pseudomonas sp.]